MSKLFDVRPAEFVSQTCCDRCGATAHHSEHDIENFLSIEINAGWNSPLGDGNRVELDPCHTSVQAILGPWLRVSTQGWARLDNSQEFFATSPPTGEMRRARRIGVRKGVLEPSDAPGRAIDDHVPPVAKNK